MDPSALTHKEPEILSFSFRRNSSSRRTNSFSYSFPSPSSSFRSSSSSSVPDSPLSPNSPFIFSGVPFSWEQKPGIPKKETAHQISNKHPSLDLLPLPPAAPTPKKKGHEIGRDPFATALMECAKDRRPEPTDSYWRGARMSRSISQRFAFVDLYGSCKKTCTVAESMVYVPRSSRSSTYNLLNRR